MSSQPIPFFDLTRQYLSLQKQVETKYSDLLKRQALIMGPAVSEFESDISKWIGVKHSVTCASGTDALILALKAMGVGPGDEVITPAFSFFCSTSSIILAGATPVLVDIDPLTYNMDVTLVEKAITQKTKVIMPVHLYGQCADMDPILDLARSKKLMVLEDFAQSVGAKYKGRAAGTMGHAGATSFYPTKNLGGSGDGGLMTTNDDDLADKMKLIRVHGMRVRYQHEMLGTNSRLDALQCAYLHIKLPYLRGWMERRQTLAHRYLSELKPLQVKGLILPVLKDSCEHVWNQFVIRVPNRDQVRAKLQEKGIPTEVYYPMTIPQQPPLRPYCAKEGWPESERASQTVLALPIFPELTQDEQTRVIEGLNQVL